MPCKHADKMMIYAKQAAEMDEPFRLWRLREHKMNPWFYPNCHFVFNDYFEYELIPKTININGHEVPEPMREKPEVGTHYFFVYASERFYDRQSWTNDDCDNFRLINGLCHTTKEAAIAHAKALFSFTEV